MAAVGVTVSRGVSSVSLGVSVDSKTPSDTYMVILVNASISDPELGFVRITLPFRIDELYSYSITGIRPLLRRIAFADNSSTLVKSGTSTTRLQFGDACKSVATGCSLT